MPSHLYVVMGVAGSGKSTIGAAFAQTLGVEFVEGDDFHPPENIALMSRGTPLTDDNRAGWLRALAARLREARDAGTGLVMTCSALKRAYRDVFRAAAPSVRFVFLRGARDVIATRLASRRGHFMPVTLLDSQFAALEEPTPDEDAWTYDASASPASIVENLTARATAQ